MSTITGNAEFNNANNNGTVEGESSFNGTSENTGTVVGDAYFSDTSTNGGTVEGNAAFYDNAVNIGEVTEAAAFLGEAENNGTIGEVMTTPQIIEQPQSVKKLAGAGDATFEITGDGSMLNCNWTQGSCGGPYGKYSEYRIINISDPGQGQARACDVLCKLENPAGEVSGNLAVCIFGVFPTVEFTEYPGDVTLNEYSNLSLSLAGTSNDDKVYISLVDALNDQELYSPVEVSVTNGNFSIYRSVVAENLIKAHNNKQVRCKVSDSFGHNFTQQFMLFVNNIDFHPQIVQHPQNVEALAGQTITFTIQTNPLTPVSDYLWGTATMGTIGVIPESYNPVGVNTDTLTITLPSDLPLGPLTINVADIVMFSCQIKGPDSPGDGTGFQYFLNSNGAGVTIVAPPEE
jgi:hypothetical protein